MPCTSWLDVSEPQSPKSSNSEHATHPEQGQPPRLDYPPLRIVRFSEAGLTEASSEFNQRIGLLVAAPGSDVNRPVRF